MKEPRIISALREHGPCNANKLAEVLGVDVPRVRVYLSQQRMRIATVKVTGKPTEYRLASHGLPADTPRGVGASP